MGLHTTELCSSIGLTNTQNAVISKSRDWKQRIISFARREALVTILLMLFVLQHVYKLFLYVSLCT